MALATLIIPAWNEAPVIARTLKGLQTGLARGQLGIVVIANACTDATAAVARRAAPDALVLETPLPGKCHALNLGLAHAEPGRPVICMDADLAVTAADLLALLAPVQTGASLAACGQMEIDTRAASPLVRSWVRGWRLNPYFACGKFGGLFALAPEAVARVFPLPEVTADDEWIRRAFVSDDIAFVPECRFVALAPRTLSTLIRVRCRSLRGAREVTALGRRGPDGQGPLPMLRAALLQPRRWIDVVVFTAVMVWVRLILATERTSPRWDRDQTTRAPVPGEG
jgi:glycosyltransferase involved in cell wall biosynthesis